MEADYFCLRTDWYGELLRDFVLRDRFIHGEFEYGNYKFIIGVNCMTRDYLTQVLIQMRIVNKNEIISSSPS